MECTLVNFRPITDEEFTNLNRFSVPPEKARAGWRFDIPACLAAMDELGLRYPVSIRFIRGRRRLGTHYARKNHHRITLSQDRIDATANETLWHELMHAKQAEDFEDRTGKPQTEFYREAYMPAKGEWGASYEHNAYELECDAFAERKQLEGKWLLRK